jgi:hypothetical protein
MIASIDDILEVLRDVPPPEDDDKKQVVNLIHKEDDLVGLLFNFIQAGYSPGVNFESGRVTALKLEFNKIFCIIQTQQLIKSAIDGVVVINSEQVYNNMNQAFSQEPPLPLHRPRLRRPRLLPHQAHLREPYATHEKRD